MGPAVALPSSCGAGGLLSAIPVYSRFVMELTASPGFKMLIVSMDAAATNKAALRTLRDVLHRREQLWIVPLLRNAHAENNAPKWGLGAFPYGPYLRTSRCFESAPRPRSLIHAERRITTALGGDVSPGKEPTH